MIADNLAGEAMIDAAGVISKLAKAGDEWSLTAAATATSSPRELDGIARRLDANQCRGLMAVASNACVTEDTLDEVADKAKTASVTAGVSSVFPASYVPVMEAVSASPVASLHAMETAVEAMGDWTREPMDGVKAIRDVDKLREFSKSWSPEVRTSVAYADAAPQDLLSSMAADASLTVRAAVAKRSTNAQTLSKLAADKEMWVRIDVAGNEHAAPETLDKLAGDESSYIRGKVAANPSTPLETLEKFIARLDSAIADRAAGVFDPGAEPMWRSMEVVYDLAANPAISEDMALRALVSLRHASQMINNGGKLPITYEARLADATPHPTLLDELAKGRRKTVLASIARNPATRPELLGKLAVDGSAMVRESAFSNPSTPTDALEKAAYELMDWKPTGSRHDWRKRSGLTAIHDNDSASEELRDRIARHLLAEYGPDETPGELGVKARVDRFVWWQSSPEAGEMAHKIHAGSVASCEDHGDRYGYADYAAVMESAVARDAIVGLSKITEADVADLRVARALAGSSSVDAVDLKPMLKATDPRFVGVALRALADRQASRR